jgi:hypothetical protein
MKKFEFLPLAQIASFLALLLFFILSAAMRPANTRRIP